MPQRNYNIGDRVHVIRTKKNARPGKDGTIIQVEGSEPGRKSLLVHLDGSQFEVWTTDLWTDVRQLPD